MTVAKTSTARLPNTAEMEDYFRKSKRRPSLSNRPFPGRGQLPRPPPRAGVPPVPAPAATTRTAREPRKRFRKKVTGLFGDQTDLQKRMKKLLREWPADILTRKPAKSHVTDTSPTQREADDLVRSVVEKMDLLKPAAAPTTDNAPPTSNPDDSANVPEKRVIAEDRNDPPSSKEDPQGAGKWKKFQTKIGRLSPRSNDLFLDELDVGSPSPESVRTVSRTQAVDREIERPTLPPLENVFAEGSNPVVRTQSLDRTATPAMLRRKVRRNERGYRGADVLRMRLSQVGETPSDGSRAVYDNDEATAALKASASRAGDSARHRSADSSPARRRTRSAMPDPAQKQSLKRRRASDAEAPAPAGDLRDHDPFALLIEAAEKESGAQANRARAADEAELPPRKSKRLRSRGADDAKPGDEKPDGEQQWGKRRHTVFADLAQDLEMLPAPPAQPTPAGADGLRFRSRKGAASGRARAETGTIGQRRDRAGGVTKGGSKQGR